MFSIGSSGKSAEAAGQYFTEHFQVDLYYSQRGQVVGKWAGVGAAALGLQGDITEDTFKQVLQGIHPSDGSVIVQAANHNGEHRAGWDSQFAPPKSVSLQALVAGDQGLISAHARAVNYAIRELEHSALSRQHGGKEYVLSENIVGATFMHTASRPSAKAEHGPDPQLHTHLFIVNMTKRPDGKWRGLDPIEIYRARTFVSAVYQSELAKNVQELGFPIQRNGDGSWELQGYTREQIMAFSTRRKDIEHELAKNVMTPQQAAVATRHGKETYDQAALTTEWQQRAAEYGIQFPVARQRSQYRTSDQIAAEAVAFSRTHNTAREAVVDRRQLEAAALQHSVGNTDLHTIRQQIHRETQRRQLVPSIRATHHQPMGAFTTPEMMTLEAENKAIVLKGMHATTPAATETQIEQWGTKHGLFKDQIHAAKLALASDHRITAIEGLAGTTKTTTVGAIRELADSRGYIVLGFGMTSGSVKELMSAGIKARTVSSLIENKLAEPAKREIWVVDESSLLSTVNTNELLKRAQQQHVEHIIFVGDQRQHHAIEAGAPIRQFLADNMAVATLNDIRRQKDPALKHAVQLAAYGHPDMAIDELITQQRVSQIADSDKRYTAISADYIRGMDAKQSTLAISPSNEERRALNHTIRNALIDAGHVEEDSRAHTVLVNIDTTPAQKRCAYYYQPGDVVHFNRGSKKAGIEKDSYLTVVNQLPDNTLLLRRDDGQFASLNPARWRGLQVYHPEQRELAQGDRIQFRIHDKHYKIANGQFGTIEQITWNGHTAIKLDSGRRLEMPMNMLRHIDYGYASTSHASQGQTIDRVLLHADSAQSAQLVNRKQFYVSLSRARLDAHIYTDDIERLKHAAGRQVQKSIALGVTSSSQQRSVGIRI